MLSVVSNLWQEIVCVLENLHVNENRKHEQHTTLTHSLTHTKQWVEASALQVICVRLYAERSTEVKLSHE